MPKKLRREPITIAPDMVGWLDNNGNPIILDHRNNQPIEPYDVDAKIRIYERQVKEWFLLPAKNLIRYNNKNKGFIVLMICLSYLEGVEQYRSGRSSNRHSRAFFISAMNRLYPNMFNDFQLSDFYTEARCGLFHNGMVGGRIIINNRYNQDIEFDGDEIRISPSKLLKDVINDFDQYLLSLANDQTSRDNFDRMYTNI